MTLEQLEERKAALLKDRLYNEKMIILLDGALQDCEHWIEQLKSNDDLVNDEKG